MPDSAKDNNFAISNKAALLGDFLLKGVRTAPLTRVIPRVGGMERKRDLWLFLLCGGLAKCVRECYEYEGAFGKQWKILRSQKE